MGAAVTPSKAQGCTAQTGAEAPEHGRQPHLAPTLQPPLARF